MDQQRSVPALPPLSSPRPQTSAVCLTPGLCSGNDEKRQCVDTVKAGGGATAFRVRPCLLWPQRRCVAGPKGP